MQFRIAALSFILLVTGAAAAPAGDPVAACRTVEGANAPDCYFLRSQYPRDAKPELVTKSEKAEVMPDSYFLRSQYPRDEKTTAALAACRTVEGANGPDCYFLRSQYPRDTNVEVEVMPDSYFLRSQYPREHMKN